MSNNSNRDPQIEEVGETTGIAKEFGERLEDFIQHIFREGDIESLAGIIDVLQQKMPEFEEKYLKLLSEQTGLPEFVNHESLVKALTELDYDLNTTLLEIDHNLIKNPKKFAYKRQKDFSSAIQNLFRGFYNEYQTLNFNRIIQLANQFHYHNDPVTIFEKMEQILSHYVPNLQKKERLLMLFQAIYDVDKRKNSKRKEL